MEVINRPPVAQTSVAETLQFIWHPHPIIPTAGREIRDITIQPGSTVREICLAAGIDAGQPITINLDDRRLTDAEWDTVCPQPGQMLSVQAAVADGGGDGGKLADQACGDLEFIFGSYRVCVFVSATQYRYGRPKRRHGVGRLGQQLEGIDDGLGHGARSDQFFGECRQFGGGRQFTMKQ